jgi:hypothetical protein
VVRPAGAIADYIEYLHPQQRAPRYVNFKVIGINVGKCDVIAKRVV